MYLFTYKMEKNTFTSNGNIQGTLYARQAHRSSTLVLNFLESELQ